jgi:methionyl aminopeptidase
MRDPNRILPAQADAAEAAALVVVETHRRVAAFLKGGQTLAQVDEFIAKQLADQSARSCFLGYRPSRRMPPFPSHACLSLNDCVVHGTAGSVRRPLERGDLLKIDIGVHYRGWIGDAAWTYSIGSPTPENARLMESGKQSLARGVLELRPGNTYAAWARVVQTCVEKEYGFHLVRGLGGHGLFEDGKAALHGPPFVSNTFPAHASEWSDAETPCEPGTLIAVEPMIGMGTGALKSKHGAAPDQLWPEMIADGSWSVHYEHDVLITEAGPRVLTQGLTEMPDVVGV